MPKLTKFVRQTSLGLSVLLIATAFPLSVLADDGTNSGSAPSSNSTGPNHPTGKGASSYHYDAATGMWTNGTYQWDPVTKQTTLIPVPVIVVPPPAAVTPDSSSALGSTDGTSTNSAPGANTDTNSNGSLGLSTNSNSGIGNNISQDANSGNAGVIKNTTGGSALTGDASDVTNLINMVCNGSVSCNPSLQGGGVTTFSTDIYGNVQGDLMIDPSQLSNLSSVSSNGQPSDVKIKTTDNSNITNDIGLNANSGDATVAQNTTGGDATTGDASTMANIVNVINSAIGANQSFLGTVNIYGNLDGDILMPPDVLNKLVTSNAGPSLTDFSSPDNSQLIANLNNNASINNNLNLTAQSGTAAVTDNTTAGAATSGDATTNITLLNLTGQQVIGKDALLVFVNVSGKWVGMIVNAPGATSAALCDSTCTSSSLPTNTNIDATSNSTITNNLTENANSGNAKVDGNTLGGNATSGNAFAGANIVNIATSQLALQNWLGILFINVFGSWNGSFGVDTAAGNPSSPDSTAVASAVKQVKVFSFNPSTGSDGSTSYAVAPITSADNQSTGSTGQPTTLAATTTKPKLDATMPAAKTSLILVSGSLLLLGGAIQTEGALNRRKTRQAKLSSYLHSITVQPFKRD